jgi:hypothetical protein
MVRRDSTRCAALIAAGNYWALLDLWANIFTDRERFLSAAQA